MIRHTPLYSQFEKKAPLPRKVAVGKTPRRPVRVLRWILLLALLGLLFFGIQNAYPALTGSDLFRLEEISVIGNRLLTPHEVADRAGLEVGGNLFEADLDTATEKLMSHPLVQKALLLRQPPGCLVISVEEREPVALVCAPGSLRGLNRAGTLFPLPQVPLDLPVVTGIQDATADATGEGLSCLADFLETLRVAVPSFLDDISEIHVTSSTEATIYLVGDGLELRMRFADAGLQARNFQAYVAAGACREDASAYVDLRFQNQVVIGKRAAVPPGEKVLSAGTQVQEARPGGRVSGNL